MAYEYSEDKIDILLRSKRGPHRIITGKCKGSSIDPPVQEASAGPAEEAPW